MTSWPRRARACIALVAFALAAAALAGGAGGCAAACPKMDEVVDGEACSHEGLSCPGTGSDQYCFDWTCTCGSDGTWSCEPGSCA